MLDDADTREFGSCGAQSLRSATRRARCRRSIYHLGPGAQYSPGKGIGTFIIPSVRRGFLFYLDTEPVRPRSRWRGYTSGEKVRCIAETPVRVCVLGGSGTAGASWRQSGQWRPKWRRCANAPCEWFGRWSSPAVPDREHWKWCAGRTGR